MLIRAKGASKLDFFSFQGCKSLKCLYWVISVFYFLFSLYRRLTALALVLKRNGNKFTEFLLLIWISFFAVSVIRNPHGPDQDE